jgi:hypothetical protein
MELGRRLRSNRSNSTRPTRLVHCCVMGEATDFVESSTESIMRPESSLDTMAKASGHAAADWLAIHQELRKRQSTINGKSRAIQEVAQRFQCSTLVVNEILHQGNAIQALCCCAKHTGQRVVNDRDKESSQQMLQSGTEAMRTK